MALPMATHMIAMEDGNFIDDFLALQSVFCRTGELSFDPALEMINFESRTAQVSIVIRPCLERMEERGSLELCLVALYEKSTCEKFALRSLPIITMHCPLLTRDSVNAFKAKVIDFGQSLMESGQFSLVSWAMEIIGMFQMLLPVLTAECSAPQPANDSPCKASDCRGSSVLLKIDHIRSTTRYFKFFGNVAERLGLSIRLFPLSAGIYVVVTGYESSVQEYLRLHKTEKVDVDCKGRPCKERLLKVVDKQSISMNKWSSNELSNYGHRQFCLDDLKSLDDMLRRFHEFGFSF